MTPSVAPPIPTLSVCLIVRNEAAHLARCLESVRVLADDLVVVDTGSSDETVAIARLFGARVFQIEWPHDFSAARNYSIARATGDWILAIDADESIAPRDHASIRAILRRDDLDAVVFPQRHYLTASTVVGWQPGTGGYEEGASYPGFVDVPCSRFFRNRRWLRFRHRVHEEIASTDPARPIAWGRGDWVLHHFGKVGDSHVLRAKADAYLQLGIAKVADTPTDPQAHYELGVQYLELDQAANALASFEQVLVLSAGSSSDVPSQPAARALDDTHLRIALCHSRLGHPERALVALRQAARAVPRLAAEIALEEGNAHRALGDDTAAARAFQRAIGSRPQFAVAHINLGLARERQGRLADAIGCLDRALALDSRHRLARLERARMRRKAGDDTGALDDLQQLGSLDAAVRMRARILLQQGRVAEAHDCLCTVPDAGDAGISNGTGAEIDAGAAAEMAGLRGAVAIRRGNLDEAVRQLRRSLALGPSYEAAGNLSTALEALGDRPGALIAAVEALRLSPGNEAMQARVEVLTALAGEPAVIERVAVHLLAGRAALAQRMIDREAAPPGLEDAWQALRTFIAWRAGGSNQPSADDLQLLARHFRSLRRPGLLDLSPPPGGRT